jgi:chromosome segregation ATPase
MKACMFKAKKQFCNNLTSQGYSGGLEFDPMNEKLDIEFSRRDGHATSSKDTRTLSGGERSFSTLCFVISIFQQISSPFMAMDEFDIFMDSVNRRISTQLLLNLAQKAKSKQFLFISPHDISMFEPSESVRIHRLKAPERNS